MTLMHNRRRWMILIVVHATYLVFHSYPYALWMPLAFDLFVNYLTFAWGPWSTIPRDVPDILLDLSLRTVTIVAGATLNAFMSYVFDLTHLHGHSSWVFLFLVYFFYLWIRILDMQRDPNVAGLDYLFPFLVMIFAFTFRDFMFFGEPYTYLTMLSYTLSVFFLCLVSSNPRVKWWAVVIFFLFWILVLLATWEISMSFDRVYKRRLERFFK